MPDGAHLSRPVQERVAPSDESAPTTRAGSGRRVKSPRPQPRWQREAFVLGPVVLLVIVTGEYVALQQAGHLPMVLAAVAFIVTQMLPGILVWRRFRPDDGWLVEDLAMGAAIGLAMGVVARVVGLALGIDAISFAVPWLLALLVMAPGQARRRVLEAGFDDLPRGWGGAVAIAGVGSVVGAAKLLSVLPVDWTGWAVVYDDSPFHVALAGELTHGWPPEYPQVAGELLHYHWFSHAWVAQLGNVSGVELVVVQDRFLAALSALLVPILIACVTMRVARAPWAGPLAAGFAVFVGPVDLWHVSVTPMPTNPLSPSVGFAAALMLAAFLVLVMRWRGELPRSSYVLLVGLVIVGGGAKATVLPIVLAGAVAAAAAVLVSRRARELVDVRAMALDSVTCLVVFALELKLVFGGGDGGLEITPLTGLAHRYVVDYGRVFTDLGVGAIVLITALVLAAQLLTMLSFVGVLRDRTSGRDPVLWFLLGGAGAGLAATLLLNRVGGSQSYFRVSGWLLLSIACGWGLWLLIPHLKGLARAQWLGLGGLFVGAVVVEQLLGPAYRQRLGLWLAPLLLVAATACVLLVAAPSRRHPPQALTVVVLGFLALGLAAWFTPYVYIQDPPPVVQHGNALPATPGAIHSDEVEAARWLRDHSEGSDIVMTNRHCRGPQVPGCKRTQFTVAAWSERDVLVEGWAYTSRMNSLSVDSHENTRGPFWDPELLRLNDRFFVHPTASAARRLRDRGVRWVFVYRALPHKNLSKFATLAHRNPAVDVYRWRSDD